MGATSPACGSFWLMTVLACDELTVTRSVQWADQL